MGCYRNAGSEYVHIFLSVTSRLILCVDRLDDLHALIAFVRCSPLDDKRMFKHYIANPFKIQQDSKCVERVRTLVDSLTLRRQKDKINLPPRIDHIVSSLTFPSPVSAVTDKNVGSVEDEPRRARNLRCDQKTV
jgi:hypothetical protein